MRLERRSSVTPFSVMSARLSLVGRTEPCAGIDRAYRLAGPGDVVEVAAGAYPLQVIGPEESRSGTDPVLVRPAPGATARLDGLEIGGRSLEVRDLTVDSLTTTATAADVVLRDLTIRGGLFVHSSQRVSVLGGSVGPGVDFHPMIAAEDGSSVPPRDIVVDGVEFHDWKRSSDSVHIECLQIGAGLRITIRNSRFRNCDVMDLHVSWWGEAPLTKDVTIERNHFAAATDGGFYAIQAYAFENLLLRGNTFEQAPKIFTDDPVRSPNVNVRVIGNTGPLERWACEPGVVYERNVWDGARCGPTDVDRKR